MANDNFKVRFQGLDLLRCLALFLVVYQHFASITESSLNLPKNLLMLNAGQTGVAFFCAISGFLALHGADSPKVWLKKRFLRIFPSYWIILIAGYIGNVIVKYKEVGVWEFILQMLGLTNFLSSSRALNVVSWFITLILFCYGLAFIIRFSNEHRRRTIAYAACTGAVLLLLFYDVNVNFFRQVAAFLAGMGIYTIRNHRLHRVLALGIILSLIVGTFLHLHTEYAAVSLVALILFSSGIQKTPGFMVSLISKYSYEIFLVHGPVLVFYFKIMAYPILFSISLALVSIVVAVYITKHTVSLLVRPFTANPS